MTPGLNNLVLSGQAYFKRVLYTLQFPKDQFKRDAELQSYLTVN